MLEESPIKMLLLKPKEELPFQGKMARKTRTRQIIEKQVEPVNEKGSNQDL